ncbi:hypothetical protein M5K25_003442 [Dendrobium thyrsiflorum]|uniref:Myb/SANT-like DNA-binding domain-containing protein n=1 Tax=Dendrobium thyrsiflorum TaxID=117978 RepID=A0ABD0VRJ4_DENTH
MEVLSRPPNPAMPYREDCWSEGETSVLVDAWGDRFLDLNRGNLRQKQWQEVADAVNARPGAGRRPPRTDVQCKNRIDTLKKKYKIEKVKISDGAYGSQWPFYSRLDMLIGSTVPAKKPPLSSSSPPLALPLPSYRKGLPLPAAAAVRAVESLPKEKRPAAVGLSADDSFFGRNYTVAAAAAAAAAEVESGSSSKLSGSSTERSRSTRDRSARGLRKKRKGREGGGIGELARVIEWFTDIYEKVEVEKQRHMIELEKERMEFIKGLEFQRMQMFVDTQVQVEKIKRARRSDADIYS